VESAIGEGKVSEMSKENIAEKVKLPEALANQLGDMIVQCQGWEQWDRKDEESSKLLSDVVWKKRRYNCPLLLPSQGIVFDEQLTADCRELLRELVENEAEFEWRAKYLDKIENLVQKAAVRLYKQVLKTKELPEDLCPRRGGRGPKAAK
jgi:hypothetical protein